MKTQKMTAAIAATMFMMIMCFYSSHSFGQTTAMDSVKMKDCCLMKEGKMVCVKDGKMIPMEKDEVMKDGTKCMTNGECKMKNGKVVKLKEGECIDMYGKIDDCSMMHKNMKSADEKKKDKKDSKMTYTCPMHPEVISDKPGKCPQCGMDLIEKKVAD